MENSYYQDQFVVIAGLKEKAAEKQFAFFQHILLVAASTFGILISLHSNSSPCQYIQGVFALSVLCLSLGILTAGTVFYDHSKIVERACQAFHAEVQNALTENRKLGYVSPPWRKRTKILEICTYVFLLLSLVLLSLYSILLAFV